MILPSLFFIFITNSLANGNTRLQPSHSAPQNWAIDPGNVSKSQAASVKPSNHSTQKSADVVSGPANPPSKYEFITDNGVTKYRKNGQNSGFAVVTQGFVDSLPAGSTMKKEFTQYHAGSSSPSHNSAPSQPKYEFKTENGVTKYRRSGQNGGFAAVTQGFVDTLPAGSTMRKEFTQYHAASNVSARNSAGRSNFVSKNPALRHLKVDAAGRFPATTDASDGNKIKFYHHDPSQNKGGSDASNSWLGNFHPTPQKISVGGSQFSTAEAAFQAGKCKYTNDPTGCEAAFSKTTSGDEAYNVSKQYPMSSAGFKAWSGGESDSRMTQVLKEKFSQPQLMQSLCGTGTSPLVETIPETRAGNGDTSSGPLYWGVSSDSKTGQNRLGGILMQIRQQNCP